MVTPTLGLVSLTGCNRISTEKTANIIPLPIPGKDADETEVFDLLGVVKLLSVDGRFSSSTISATKSLIDALEALITGDQSTVSFTSDQTGTISVMVNNVAVTWEVPGFIAVYSIKLVQGLQI